MGFRSTVRQLVIQPATFFQFDELAIQIQKRSGAARGFVVGMHETPKAQEARLRRQLEWVAEHFTISSLQAFSEIWANQVSDNQISDDRISDDQRSGNFTKPPILFTFDDGRESNYTVAAPLLESFGGRGVFFIVPAFAECSDDADALTFYRSNINPDWQRQDEPYENWKPMRPGQIADLAARGHAIGSHTLNHQNLAGLSPECLDQEIGDSARKLAAWTNKPVDAFAWTFGWDAIDANAFETIQRYHHFCFAPCAGTVDASCDSPSLIWRREIEVKYTPPEYRFLYSGLADPWWSSRRRRLRKMLGASERSNVRKST